jgi:hypothetical protein
MAFPTYQAQAVGGATATTTSTITCPATQAGDILLISAINAGSTAAILPMVSGNYNGGGWTGFNGAAMTSSWGGFFWSRCTQNHSGQTIGIGTAVDSLAAGLIVVRGAVPTGNPLDTNSASVTRTANGMTMAGFNTTVDETLLVMLMNGDNDTSFSAQTANGVAMTERFDLSCTGGADSQAAAATINGPATAGATGSFAATRPNALSARYTVVAIKPAVPITVTLTPATETDAAQPLAFSKPIRQTLTPATELDTAEPISLAGAGPIFKTLTPADELDAAVPLSFEKDIITNLTPALEADAAQPLVFTKPIRQTLTPAAETDAAQALAFTKPIKKDLTPATEADAAVAIAFKRAVTLIPALETDAAVALAFEKDIIKALTPAVETDAAVALAYSKPIPKTLTPATEADVAVALSYVKAIARTLTPATETDVAVALSITKAMSFTLTPAEELDVAVALVIDHEVAPLPRIEVINRIDLFPPGTTIKAYLWREVDTWVRAIRPDILQPEPYATPVETQIAGADGTATFTNLLEGERYVFVALRSMKVDPWTPYHRVFADRWVTLHG